MTESRYSVRKAYTRPEEIKQYRILAVLVCFICLVTVLGTIALYMREYRRSAFIHLSAFCEKLTAENPEMEVVVLDTMKQYRNELSGFGAGKDNSGISETEHGLYTLHGSKTGSFLEQYGYRSGELRGMVPGALTGVSAALVVVLAGGFLFVVWYPRRYSRIRIGELTDYLEQINTGGECAILQTKEDHFSRLQDEMYKTVTELYRTREQAVEAKVNYAENLANIAHQLKTPITAAFLSLQMMEKDKALVRETGKAAGETVTERDKEAEGNVEGEKAAENVQKYVSRIKKQLERLQSLEEALLTLSRIDAGVLQMERAEVDIYTVLNLACENLQDLLLQKEISVTIPDRGCATFRGDLEWTMEAMINLMKNCMEHSPRGSTIHCDYSVNLLYAQIRIWDEGTGFAPEELPHLFERFYRGRALQKDQASNDRLHQSGMINSIKGNDTGVGIGLSLARLVIELQNGTITARNLPQGGACFEIRIYSH